MHFTQLLTIKIYFCCYMKFTFEIFLATPFDLLVLALISVLSSAAFTGDDLRNTADLPLMTGSFLTGVGGFVCFIALLTEFLLHIGVILNKHRYIKLYTIASFYLHVTVLWIVCLNIVN